MERCASPLYRMSMWSLCAVLLLLVFNAGLAPAQTVRFAAIGDYGLNTTNEQNVANIVTSHTPDIIITTGDNNYPSGSATTIDNNVGKYYHNYIAAYTGAYPPGAATNKFFPSMGNHDLDDGSLGAPYYSYFTLPGAGITSSNTSGNERYYDYVVGPVHFFVINSDPREPNGITSSSVQALWLQAQLAAATEPWKVVYFHHPPYTSCTTHAATTEMRWPFEAWGASAVLEGHNHVYERIVRDDNTDGVQMPYITIGNSGSSIYAFGTPTEGSQYRYSADYGAVIAEATTSTLNFKFYSVSGGSTVLDEMTLTAPVDPEYLETFDTFTVGQPVSAQSGWYTDGIGPTVGASNGVAGSRGLNGAQYNATWLDHEFIWNDTELQKVALGMDFQTSPAGLLDDDRVCWTILNNSTSSDAHFGVQLDNTSGGNGIETYWDNVSGTSSNIRVRIASLPTLANSAWYRIRAEITKLTASSASIAVTLNAIDALGNVGALVASGTMRTDTMASSRVPDPKYFSAAAMWPAYKNFNSTEGMADNAYFSITEGGSTGVYSLTTNVVGSGTVTKNPLQSLYDPNAVVTLTANALAGYQFSGWSGDLSGSTNPTTITMTSNKTVTATFTQLPVGDTAVVVPFGAMWKYSNNNAVPGAGWQATAFDDAAWPSGPARIGGGDPSLEATSINIGPSGNVYPTIYFRTSFNVANPALYTSMGINLIRDDGAVIYLNGTEVWRSNMPAGTITHATLAAATVGGADETAVFNSPSFSTAALVTGTNVVAVEVHQINLTSTDLGLDLRLYGLTASGIPRTLTVGVVGQGSVTKLPDQAQYNTGSIVQLTATPNPGWVFAGWSGDLTGSTNPASITMTADKNITATFTQIPAGDIATIVPFGAIWSYRDWGVDLGTAWRAPGFNSAPWPTGPARLGFGDTQATTINSGSEGNDNPTLYFRTSFGVSDPSIYTSLGIDLIRDDGAVIYLNGTEVWRSNMPGGTISFATLAAAAVDGANETAIFSSPSFGTSALIAGTNVLAVEVHQINATSGDLGFDMRLFGTTATGPKTLTVNVIGQGSVTKVPDQAQYNPGTVVQLTAIPSAGWQFTGWSGDLIGTTNPVNVTMGATKSITATFVNPTASLVGHWRFNETNGTVANDASGYGNTGAVTGGTWGTGKIGGALALNGTTGVVSIPPSSSLTFTNQITFACWMNADALTTDAVALFSRATAAGENGWIDFVLHARRLVYMPVAYQCAFYIDLNGDSQMQAIEDRLRGYDSAAANVVPHCRHVRRHDHEILHQWNPDGFNTVSGRHHSKPRPRYLARS